MEQITISGHTATIEQVTEHLTVYHFGYEKNAKGEKLCSITFQKGQNDLFTKAWYKDGLTKKLLKSWWIVNVGVGVEKSVNFVYPYNPTFKAVKKDDKIDYQRNFDWIFEATEENAIRILEEIVKRFFGSDPLRPETDGGSTSTERPKPTIAKQFENLKAKHPDAVLLFRVGDFYETYNEDAKTINKVLGVTLTKAKSEKCWHKCLAGFPAHALDKYLPKLTKANYRVAICDLQ